MNERAKSGRATAIIALAAIFASLLFLLFPLYTPPPSFNAAPHEALGSEMATETLKLLGPAGRIFVITRETTAFDNPGVVAQLKSFHQSLKKAGATVAATNLIKVDPLRLVAVPPGEFFEILRKGSENDAVASFLGPPTLSRAQIAKLGARHPRVVAVCSPVRSDLKTIFADQLLHTAIVYRRVVPSRSPPMDTPSAWFAHLYQIVTPANLSELPTPAPP
jgi:hypothetical protein